MRLRRSLLVVLVAAVAVAGLGQAGAMAADASGVTALRDKVAPNICLVTAEDALGLPMTYASGFLLGDGGLVVTDLASVAQADTKQVSVRFRDGKTAVAKQFRWADPAAGLAILVLDGSDKTPGLSLSTAAAISGGDSTVVGWKWAESIDTTTGRLVNGISAATVAERVKVAAPLTKVSFLRLDTERPELASGSPVIDSAGGVVGALLQVSGTDKALVVPSSVLREALLSEEVALKPVSQLPAPLWPVMLQTQPGKPSSLLDFALYLQNVRDHSRCPKCGGKGVVTIAKPASSGSGSAAKSPVKAELETCPVCKGEGVLCAAHLYREFETLAWCGTSLATSADTEAKARDGILTNMTQLLKSLARVGAGYRTELVHQAKDELTKEKFPRGLVVFAQVTQWSSGPEGQFLLMESESIRGKLAVKTEAIASAGGKTDKSIEGQWIILAGIASGPVTIGKQRPILVQPLAWCLGPSGKLLDTVSPPPPPDRQPPIIRPPVVTPPHRTPKEPGEPNFFGL